MLPLGMPRSLLTFNPYVFAVSTTLKRLNPNLASFTIEEEMVRSQPSTAFWFCDTEFGPPIIYMLPGEGLVKSLWAADSRPKMWSFWVAKKSILMSPCGTVSRLIVLST